MTTVTVLHKLSSTWEVVEQYESTLNATELLAQYKQVAVNHRVVPSSQVNGFELLDADSLAIMLVVLK